jgi:hypothetical protein
MARGNALDFWCAGTLGNGHIFGFATDRRLTSCNAGFSHPLFAIKAFSTRYAVAATPFAWLSEPALFNADSARLHNGQKHVFGAGASPVGIQILGPPMGRFRIMLESLGGFLYFRERVLSPQASQFNFTIDLAPTVLISTSPNSAIVAGFRYHHMSNANISNKNPGLDSEIVYVGVRLFR